MKDYQQCCAEVAKKHGLGSKLVTGHKASYFEEAAALFEAEIIESISRQPSRRIGAINMSFDEYWAWLTSQPYDDE